MPKKRIVLYLEEDNIERINKLAEIRKKEHIEHQIQNSYPPSRRMKHYPKGRVVDELLDIGFAWSGLGSMPKLNQEMEEKKKDTS